jgi:hypothetical protein
MARGIDPTAGKMRKCRQSPNNTKSSHAITSAPDSSSNAPIATASSSVMSREPSGVQSPVAPNETFHADESDSATSERPSPLKSATSRLSTDGVSAALNGDQGELPPRRMYQVPPMTAHIRPAVAVEITEAQIADLVRSAYEIRS